MIRTVFAISILAAAIQLPDTALAGSILERAAGKWSGTGWARRDANAPRELVKCRLSAKFVKKQNRLSVSGKCTGGGRSVRLSGRFVDEGAGDFSGKWSTGSRLGADQMTGRQNGNKIRFNWQSRNQKTGKVTGYFTQWNVQKSKLSVATGLRDNSAPLMVEINFTR